MNRYLIALKKKIEIGNPLVRVFCLIPSLALWSCFMVFLEKHISTGWFIAIGFLTLAPSSGIGAILLSEAFYFFKGLFTKKIVIWE
jgi:hypothetical protein